MTLGRFHGPIALPDLTYLSITLMTTGWAHNFPDTKDCRMSAVANAVPNLKNLRVAIVPYGCQGLLNLAETFGSIVWPHLSKLRLQGLFKFR